MAADHLIEMLEKDDSDPEVSANIDAFREAISSQWKFEDKFLAFDPRLFDATTPEPPMPGSPEATGYTPSGESEPSTPEPVFAEAVSTPVTKPAPAPTISVSSSGIEEKTAFLLYSTVKHADLVYTERFKKGGNLGFKIEAPGTMVIEILMDGDTLKIDPPNFGDSEGAQAIKAEFEAWLNK
jgi:hypothetical protein